MAVTGARSASVAGRISSEDIAGEVASGKDMDGRLFSLAAKEKPRPQGRGLIDPIAVRSVALTEQLQQQREQVDEVQVERQRTGNRRAFGEVNALGGISVDLDVLQPLGVIGGKAREHENADHREEERHNRTTP